MAKMEDRDAVRVTAWIKPGSGRDIKAAYKDDNDPTCSFAAFVGATIMIGACEAVCEEVHTLANFHEFPGAEAGFVEDEWKDGERMPNVLPLGVHTLGDAAHYTVSNQRYEASEVLRAVELVYHGRRDAEMDGAVDFMRKQFDSIAMEVQDATGDMDLYTRLQNVVELLCRAERRRVRTDI